MTKRTISAIALAGAVLVIFGCSKGVRYSPTEISGYPPKVQEQIKSGELTLGMSTTVVRYTWGTPGEVVLKGLDPEGRSHEEWVYFTPPFFHTRLVFKDNKLVGIISGVSTNEEILPDKKIGTSDAPKPAEAPKEPAR